MSLLQVDTLCRNEESGAVLQDVSFNLSTGEKLAIAGATGSGKTTLLKMIAGMVQPHAGTILFEGSRLRGPDEKLIPGHPRIAYLSQHFELLNHYRVIELLQMAGDMPDEAASRIYATCRIEHLLQRWTHQVSGGERQRIALARTLVKAPRLLLLDEPYSNLDAFHKETLKAVVDAICNDLGITCILISHDPPDMLSWADRIIVLQNGRMVQQGTPVALYRQPVSEYAAGLFGKYTVLTLAQAKAFAEVVDLRMESLTRFFRPEHFRLAVDTTKGVKGEVTQVRFMGSYYELEINIAGSKLLIHHTNGAKQGDVVYVSLV